MISKRAFLGSAAGAAAALFGVRAAPAFAEAATYPAHPVRWIVPYAAGGATDVLSRMVCQYLSEKLGQSFVVENKPGAGSTIGTQAVINSPADGYTLLLTSTANAINASFDRTLPFDFAKSIAPVAGLARIPLVLVVNNDLPVTNVAEFIAYAKANPGLAFGSAGVGSPQHLGAEMLKSAANIDIRHVPYRGSIPAMLDVIAGHIPFMIVDLQPALQQIKEGKVRVLGVTTPKRVAAAPDIPTIAEGGLPGYELVAWQGVVAPAGTPRPIVDVLAGQIARLLSDPATRERFTSIAIEPLPVSTPDSFADYIRTEVDRWTTIVKNSGAEAE